MEKELEKARSVGDQVAELMEQNRLLALQTYRDVLQLPNDLEYFDGDHLAHHRRVQMQLHAAVSFGTLQSKVDDAALRAQQHEDWLEAFNKKLADAEAKLLKHNK